MSKWTKLSAVLTLVVVLLGCSSAAMAIGTVAVGDRVWYDDDNDGIQDDGELGINGVLVTLTGPSGTVLSTTETKTVDVAGVGTVDGYYVFGGLAQNNTYTVTLTAGPGTPLEGFTKTSTVPNAINLDHGATVTLPASRMDVDFGYYKPVVVLTYEVGDRVWHDVDEDTVQDAGEVGINDATVMLYKWNTTTLTYDYAATTWTAGDGIYNFSGLSLGDYRIDVSGTPTGWYNTFDISAPFNSSATFTLTANRYDVDFGYAMTPTGDFCTFTQGGWGAKPSGNNPGKLLHTYWSTVFPNGLVVGGTKTLTFTTAQQVTDFLPQGGTAAALKTSYPLPGQPFPKKTEAGVLAGQVVALKLSVSFSNKGIAPCSAGLGALIIQSGPYAGYTCANFLDLAEKVLGGDITNVNISAINDTATKINESFDNGTVNTGYLK